MKLNNKQKLLNLSKVGLTVFISIIIVSFVVKAGSLTPTADPAATSYTLTDIYGRLNTNATATEGSHNFAPGASPTGTLYSLTQIYEAIPTIIANTVKLGTSYLGIAGSLTPDGGTAVTSDLFDSKTAHLTNDWNLDTGTLNLACNTALFDGAENIVADAYDGSGGGTNRWCMTDTGDVTVSQMKTGSIAWVDGQAITGTGTQTLSDSTTTLGAGYYEATTLDAVDNDLIAGNISSGVTIFGITGSFPGYAYGDASQVKVLTSATGAGTYDASNLAVGTVKSGTVFGVGLTGDYPSATYPLSGDTAATDATAAEVCNASEAWTKAGGLLTGTLNPTASNVRIGNTYCGVDGTYSGYPGTGWTGGTTITQAACDAETNWNWFEDGNGDGDTTDPEDGICVKATTVTSLSWNGYDYTTNYDNTYIAAYTCSGSFPSGTVATYSGLDSAGISDTTWNDGDCALCQADCYDGVKDLPGQGGYTSNAGGAGGYQGPITPEVLKEWKGTRLPASNDFFGFCGATSGDIDSTAGDSLYYSSGASANVNIGNYGKNVGRGTGSEYMDLSNTSWEWLSEQHDNNSARIAGSNACSDFYSGHVNDGYRFRAVFRP